jgi:hypothetical protein
MNAKTFSGIQWHGRLARVLFSTADMGEAPMPLLICVHLCSSVATLLWVTGQAS